MASVSQLVECLAGATETPGSKVGTAARQLLDDEVLPKASGRAVPHVTFLDAALLVFAVMASPTVARSSSTALKYAGLVSEGISEDALGEGAPPAVRARRNCANEFAALLENLWRKNLTHVQAHVEIVETWPEVTIMAGERSARYVESGKTARHWHGPVRRSVQLSGLALVAIAHCVGPVE